MLVCCTEDVMNSLLLERERDARLNRTLDRGLTEIWILLQ